jgi:hypothetical protein
MARRAALLLAWLWLGSAACSEYGPRVYTAHPYPRALGCLGDSTAIGVVQAGELKANCPPICLLLDGTLYVSEVCAPHPVRALLLAAEDSLACAEGISLFQSLAFCKTALPSTPDAGSPDGSAGD